MLQAWWHQTAQVKVAERRDDTLGIAAACDDCRAREPVSTRLEGSFPKVFELCFPVTNLRDFSNQKALNL